MCITGWVEPLRGASTEHASQELDVGVVRMIHNVRLLSIKNGHRPPFINRPFAPLHTARECACGARFRAADSMLIPIIEIVE